MLHKIYSSQHTNSPQKLSSINAWWEFDDDGDGDDDDDDVVDDDDDNNNESLPLSLPRVSPAAVNFPPTHRSSYS